MFGLSRREPAAHQCQDLLLSVLPSLPGRPEALRVERCAEAGAWDWEQDHLDEE